MMAEAVKNNAKKTFLSGVMLLSLSTVLVKLIGLIYKIPMLAYLGSEGMGYFNSAYEIYALFCVISTAGLPVALSVLISDALARGETWRVRRIYRAAMTVFLLIGFLGSAVMVLFAKQFCRLIQSENAYGCILSISPTVFLVCVSSALRGYFQGHQRMFPTALSQILESAGKLLFGLLFAHMALEKGYDTATVASFAGWGLTLGTGLSLAYLLIEKRRFATTEADMAANGNADMQSYRTVWRGLARLAIPMTLGASLVSLTKLIDMTMILRRLQDIGYSESLANAAYGSYTTLALSVYGLLPSLVSAVALPLVPMLSAAIAAKDRQRQKEMTMASYRLTALFAIPASLGMSAFASPVLSLLFANDSEAVSVAAPLLSCLGVSVFLSCMITATNSVLHAYQVVVRPILALLAGAAVKIVFAYALIGNAKIALTGAPISTFLCNVAVVGINLYFTERICRVEGLLRIFTGPLLSGGAAVGASYAVYLLALRHGGTSAVFTLFCIVLAVLLYLLFSCRFGVLAKEDFSNMPQGERIWKLLGRLKLIPKEKEIQPCQRKKRFKH